MKTTGPNSQTHGRNNHEMGFDLSGVVEAIGKDVRTMAIGDAVYGNSNVMRQGAYAEYAS
jgi:NADPH:quinone reductase-like Zn-dependent oxidoreductase